MTSGHQPDPELQAVAAHFREIDSDGFRTANVLRETFDQLYDGQRTGRYRWDQLYKTEKTHFGTLVEINLHREFKFGNGNTLDYQILGTEVDCKFSQSVGAWMIPPEALNHICLVVSAQDTNAPKWSMGLVRVTRERLNAGGNRDAKSTLNGAGRAAIEWLFREEAMPANVLLQLDESAVQRIFSRNSGQQRINELFRLAQGRIVGRGAIATVAQQDDYMKRLRFNGGARSSLQSEGIIILGQYRSHVEVAEALGLPVPGRGDSVSVRVCQVRRLGVGVARIEGKYWRLAKPNDPIESAPRLQTTLSTGR